MGTNQTLRRIAEQSGVEKLCKEAYRESQMIAEQGRGRGGVSKDYSFEPFFLKHVVNIKDKPVSLSNFENFDPDVKTTGGFFSIQYVPQQSLKRYKNRPYCIGQDLIRMRVVLSGYRHWGALAESIPELSWLRRWCPSLTPELFGLAKRHPGINFYFSPDWVGYAKMIEEKAEKEGIDIDKKAFVTYAASEEKIKEINSTHFLAPLRTIDDVRDIVNETAMKFPEEE